MMIAGMKQVIATSSDVASTTPEQLAGAGPQNRVSGQSWRSVQNQARLRAVTLAASTGPTRSSSTHSRSTASA
jgi:hypothetical protein